MARRRSAPLKSDASVLVSPAGRPVHVYAPTDLHNLLARGYKPQPKVDLAEVEAVAVEKLNEPQTANFGPARPEELVDGGGPVEG